MEKTFLSNEIQNFLQISDVNFDLNQNNYISENLCLLWGRIEQNVEDCNDEKFVIHDQTENWFKEKISFVHKVMHESFIKIKNSSGILITKMLQRSKWMNRNQDLILCYEYYNLNTDTSLLKCVLILTSIIERSLGNVYLINDKNVPFLLKELLETKYLHELLGNGPIRLMQILFGTSRALNIRNLSWHGFLSKNELNQYHIAILFILIAAIGDILQLKNINNIPQRPQIANIDRKIQEIIERNHLINIFTMSDLETIITKSNLFIGSTHLVFWDEILTHPAGDCSNNCVILILPIFEHLMRRIYCKINNCNHRNITAMTKEKYLTLDEIFDENFEQNKIYNISCNGAYDFYQDIFSHLPGLRLRDKVSHGEICLNSLSCKLTEFLLNFILYCICRTNTILNIGENVVRNFDLVKILNTTFEKYESVYHNSTILKYKIVMNFEDLQKVLEIPKPSEDKLVKCETIIENHDFHDIICKLSETIGENPKIFMRNMKIFTINRPKSELRLIKLLTKIVECASQISHQIIENNEERYKNFVDNTLGSRQINKYDEILRSISIVYDFLNCILNFIVFLMYVQFHRNDVEYSSPIFRFLLDTQKYGDKILRFSNVKMNKWSKVRILISEYEKQLNYVFEKYLSDTIK